MKLPFLWTLLLAVLLVPATTYQMQTLDVNPLSTTVNEVTQYSIYLTREFTSDGSLAPWDTQLVPAGSNVVITFPSVYNTLVGYTCNTPYQTCYVSGQTLIIPNLFPTDTALRDMTIVVNNVRNPTPAKTTAEFMATVGNEYTVPSSNPNAIVILTPASFQQCSISFSPGNVNRNASMIVTATPTNVIPAATGTVVVTFPNAGSWFYDILQQTFGISSSMLCVNYTTTVMSSVSCSGGQDTNGSRIVTANGMFSTDSSAAFGISISNILSPPTTYPKDVLYITSQDNGYAVDTCSVTVSGLIANTISVSITPTTTMVVNQPVSLRFSVNLTDIINYLDTFQVTFPSGSKLTAVTVSGGGTITVTNLKITNSTIVSFNQSTSNKNFPAGSNLNITFSNFTAPPSTQSTQPIVFAILRDGFSKMVGSGTVQAIMNTLTFTVAASATLVNLNTTYVFNITILDALSSSGRIKIDFPSSIKPSWGSTSCAALSGTNASLAPTCAQSFNSLILTGINASSNNIGPQTLSVTVHGVTNPGSSQPSGNFTVTTYYSTTDDTSVAIGTMGTITATTATISANNVTIVPSSYIVGSTGVSYTVSFVTGNAIPLNGFIVLGIPLAIQTTASSISSNCLSSIGAATPTSTVCTATSNTSNYIVNFTKLFQSAGIAANITLNLRVANIFTNPQSTLPVSSFSIATYSATGYLIEQISSGLSISMTTPADFTSATVSATSQVNSATTEYTFTLGQTSPLSASSFLDVVFPAEVSLNNPTCKDLTGTILSCSVSSKTVSVTLPSTAVASSFGVKINGVVNPPSQKPSSRFGFRTRTPDGVGKYSENLSSVSITNTVPSVFPYISGTFTPQTLKSSVTTNIVFTPSNQNIGSAILNIATSFTVATLSCQSFLAFSGSCTQSGSNSHNLNLTGTFTNGNMSFSVAGLTTGTTIPSDYSVFTTYDSSGYIMDQSKTDIIFVHKCTLPCRTCSGTLTTCASCYNDSAITSAIFYYSQGSSCLATCPNGFYSETATYTCASCASTCLTCHITATNCLSCVQGSANPYFNTTASGGSCLSQCDYGMYPDATNTCVVCVAPCNACTNLTSCLSCVAGRFFYQTNCLVSCPANTTVANSSTNVCDPCSSNCLTCLGSTTNCSSCSVGTALYQGSCVTQCPDPLVNKTGVCQPCDPPCLTCSQISTNCTSCISTSTTPHYFSNLCLDACPSTYYNETATSACLPCSNLGINCVLCKSATSCIACDAGFVFFPSNSSCLSFTPSGYANVSGIAVACAGDCATCDFLTTNCTSCKTLNLLGNQCMATCPSTFAPVFGVCTPCASPCMTCSQTTTQCTSCLSTIIPPVYLSGTNCVQTCPSSTYANSTLQQCVTCQSPCLTCSTKTICQSCVTGYNLYLSTCLNGFCPGGYTAVASACVACQSPCLTCSTSTSTCTSCRHGLVPEVYLTNITCVQANQCPNGTYPEVSNNLCTACQPPCSTCSSLTVCLSCITGYNLDGTLCKSNCLDGYMPINAVCTPCTAPCTTCAGTLTTCLSCSLATNGSFLYLLNYKCLATCPNSTYANGTTLQCSACQTPCSYCNSLANCTTCMGGFFLYGNYCFTECPLGYVGIGLNCEKCGTGCLSCQNSTFTCTECQAGYYRMNLTNECVAQCPNGLYADPIQSVCIGCTPPCHGCTGTTNNCTICATGSLYNNSCVATCPDAYFSYNAICQQCPLGCINCTSLTRCTECDANYYALDNSCVLSCPPNKAIVVNKTCTPCTKGNCSECNAADYCLVCSSPFLLHMGDCVASCPTNFTSNGTACVAVSIPVTPTVNKPPSIFPLPFSIASVVVIVMCIISKFQNSHTFASGAIYALLGIWEWGALLALAILYSINYAIDYIFWIVVGAILLLYVINVLAFAMMFLVYRKDLQFAVWSKRTCSSKASEIVALCIGLAFTHKYYNMLFSRLFGFYAFKAQLESVSKFFWLHLVSLVSLVQSVMAIAIASYIIHQTKDSVNQTLLCALDVVVVYIVNILAAGSNAHKSEDFFEEYDGEIALNKKINAEDSCHAKSVDQIGEGSQRESAYCGRHTYGDPISSLVSMKQINDKEEESVGQLIVDGDSAGDQARPVSSEGDSNIFSADTRNLADVSVQAVEILDDEPEEYAGCTAPKAALVFEEQVEPEPEARPREEAQAPKSSVQLLVDLIEKASGTNNRERTQKSVRTEKTEEIKQPAKVSKVEASPSVVTSAKPLLVEVKRKTRYDDWTHADNNQAGVQLEPSRLSATTTIKHAASKQSPSSRNGTSVHSVNGKEPNIVVVGRINSGQPDVKLEPRDEGFEVINATLRDSQIGPDNSRNNTSRPRTPSPTRKDLDEEAKAKNAQRERILQQALREKEKELSRIRKKVQIKEREKQLTTKSIEHSVAEDTSRKASARQTSSFTSAAEVQDPLVASKSLKKEQHVDRPILSSNAAYQTIEIDDYKQEDRPQKIRNNSPARSKNGDRKKQAGSRSFNSHDNTMEELLQDQSQSRNRSPNDFTRLEQSQQQNPTPFTDALVFEDPSVQATHRTHQISGARDSESPKQAGKIRVEDIDLQKSEVHSNEEISANPLGNKRQNVSVRQPQIQPESRQPTQFSEVRESVPRMPIILTANSKLSFAQKPSSKNNSPARRQLVPYRTVELKAPPKKSTLVFETNEPVESDSADMDYYGISPSHFNLQNQRVQEEAEVSQQRTHYGVPSKPSIMRAPAREQLSEAQSRQMNRRLPMMVGVTGDSSSLDRPYPSDADEGLKDYYEVEKKIPRRKPPVSAEKRSPSKSLHRPSSRQS